MDIELNELINKLIFRKMKKFLWLFTSIWGRYFVGAFFLLMGVFSEYSTIDFLSTDLAIFEYSVNLGVLIILVNFLYQSIGAIIVKIINRNE